MTRRLLLLTPAELTRDPRARRAAVAAQAHGWRVAGVSGQFPGDEPSALEGVDVRRVPHRRGARRAVRAAAGALGASGGDSPGPLARELRGLYQLARLASQTIRLARVSRPLGPVHVVHANDLDTLPAAWLIARRNEARLVYDAHELYTAQEPDPPRLHRAVAARLERALGRRADAVVTVSDPIADELVRRLRLARRPVVVLNCPERRDGETGSTDGGPLRAVYQAGMNAARPIEDLLDAAPALDGVELTLRIARADPAALRAEVARRGLTDRVVVSEPVPPDRLVEELFSFDVGLVIDRPFSRNNELGFPNKLFEYLMAGLAVVVPRLPTMSAFVEREGVGVAFPPGEPLELAAALNALSDDRERLRVLRHRAREVALDRYNAETQSQGLLEAWGA